MNIIQVKIDFEQGICRNEGISVVTGDYNSTKVVFEFNDSSTGTKIFKMKDPNDELVYADEIVNNEIVLTGQKDVVDTNGYIKYLDDNQNVYWYDSTNDVIYNSNYEETTGVELDTLTKQTEIATLFGEEGDYTFEVSLYQDDGRLTSVCDYITANKEQVIVDGEEVQERITLFDNLMNELATAIVETNNLDLDAEKVEHTTTVVLTKKDGTEKTIEILDGEKGDKGDKGDAGAIKMQIVVELPLIGQEDTIYLVPLEEPETQENRYAEYVWVNNQWELLGKIGIQVDLTDYVKNTDYATSNKGGVFKTGFGIQALEGTIAGEAYTYNDYQGWRDLLVVSKGTLENVIAGKDLTTKAYVDGLVGDINTALDTINGEVI